MIASLGHLRAVAWLFPPPPLRSVTALSYEELRKKYRSRDWWGNVIASCVFISLAGIYWGLMELARRQLLAPWSNAEHILAPHPILFVVMACFMSLMSGYSLMFPILRWWFGHDEWKIYSTYGCYRACPYAPFNVTRFFHWTVLIWFPLLVVGCLFFIDHFTAFTETTIADNPLSSLGKESQHQYADVVSIYEVRGHIWRGEFKVFPYELIVFNDGTHWTSEKGQGEIGIEKLRKAMRYVADKSGADYFQVDTSDKIPGL